MFNIVLLEPEIPANTGNIGRTCLVTGSRLHLIEPMGFILNDKKLKRAGMDYWKDLDVTVYDSWLDFVQKNQCCLEIKETPYSAGGISGNAALRNAASSDSCRGKAFVSALNKEKLCDSETARKLTENPRIWMATTKAKRSYDQAVFQDGDFIMFGKESAGIPEEILMEHEETCIRIPMASGQRSLNLANSVSVVLYEALRQNQFLDLELAGQLHNHVW
ncbi:MAG: tRNA (cytidine(34)-2'-O)-methyltransferase [Parasporobacterium sp.]|nr:tRNA (cytidine(34)-2'-O)-methyltransferase [Parasporobacterium sp.]